MQHLYLEHLYYLILPKSEPPGHDFLNSQWIVLGFTADRIERLHEQISLKKLLPELSGLAGIRFVKIESKMIEES